MCVVYTFSKLSDDGTNYQVKEIRRKNLKRMMGDSNWHHKKTTQKKELKKVHKNDMKNVFEFMSHYLPSF